MKVVQDNTTIVYLIDDTGSQRNLHAELIAAFSKLLAKYRTNSTIRLAALVQGGDNSPRRRPLNEDERRNLGRSNLIRANNLTPIPTRTPNPDIFGGFKAPRDLSIEMISDAINDLSLSRHNEFLYPGIALAREKINGLCSGSSASWCDHKVIVVLGDGRPGKAHDDYFDPPDGDIRDELPEKLLEDLRLDGIRLDTLCLGYACTYELIRVGGTRYYYDKPTCPTPVRTPPTTPFPTDNCIRHTGKALMLQLSVLTNGRHYW